MANFDIKLPQLNTIEELSEARKKAQEEERRKREEALRRRQARQQAARRRLRNQLIAVAAAGLLVVVLIAALSQGKTTEAPGTDPNGAPDNPSAAYNDNGEQQNGQDVGAVAPADPAEVAEPQTETEKAVAYVKALGKGESTYDYADTSGRISQNKSATKKVALTFDDGPYPGKTEEYLKILQEYGVPATFFCLGSYVENNPDTAKAIVDAGCEIASHSWNHKNMPKQSKEIMQEDFRKTAAAFEEAVGFAPYLFRAPYGSTSETLQQVAKENGAVMIFWSVDTNDWRKPSADTLVNRAVNDARDGSIILMHENKANTLAALPRIITYLQAKGYELVTVSELLYENSAEQLADQEDAAGEGQQAAPEGTDGTAAGNGGNGQA